jgi:hypothetical protein
MIDIDQPPDPDFLSHFISFSIAPAPNLHPVREKRCSVSAVQGRLHHETVKKRLLAPEDSLPITVKKVSLSRLQFCDYKLG